MKKKVVIGFIGTQLDSGIAASRWERWRPTVSLVLRENLVIDKMMLLYDRNYQALADLLKQDIATVSPETEVTPVEMSIANPWDFGQVYAALFDLAEQYPFDIEHEEYWIHITTGTHVVQICLFLMVEARYFPGVLLQTSPPSKKRGDALGSYTLIDLD